MSIQQPGNFNGRRMVSTTFDSITERFEETAGDAHASIILDDRFWSRLQSQLIAAVSKKRQLLVAGDYTEAARQLRTIGALSTRTAVEDFRADAFDVPRSLPLTTSHADRESTPRQRQPIPRCNPGIASSVARPVSHRIWICRAWGGAIACNGFVRTWVPINHCEKVEGICKGTSSSALSSPPSHTS